MIHWLIAFVVLLLFLSRCPESELTLIVQIIASSCGFMIIYKSIERP